MRGIIKARPVPDNIKLSSQCNFAGAGRPLAYPVELDEELLKWILVLRDFHFPVSFMGFQEKAKLVIQHHNPSFSTSCDWVDKCFIRQKICLRARTSVIKKPPKQLESILRKFYEDTARFMRIEKYPLSLVGNMDETPAFFDMKNLQSVLRRLVLESAWFVHQGVK